MMLANVFLNILTSSIYYSKLKSNGFVLPQQHFCFFLQWHFFFLQTTEMTGDPFASKKKETKQSRNINVFGKYFGFFSLT